MSREATGDGSNSAIVDGKWEADGLERHSRHKSGSGKTPPTLATGCTGGAKPGGLLADESIDVDGVTRSYQLEVPTNYNPSKPYPIVWVFHGDGGWGQPKWTMFRVFQRRRQRCDLRLPKRSREVLRSRVAPTDENKDVALFDQLTANLAASYCVDTSRVFATGFSNGAFFSNQLGCRRGDKLRAIAAHSGGGPYDSHGDLKCVGPAPAALVVHGTLDVIVSPNDANQSVGYFDPGERMRGRHVGVFAFTVRQLQRLQETRREVHHWRLGSPPGPRATEKTWSFFSSL